MKFITATFAFYCLSFLSVASMVYSSTARAQTPPTPILGYYVFQNEITSSLTIRRETVLTRSPQGETRLAELKNNGYQCQLVSSATHRCRRTSSGEIFPAGIQARLIREQSELGELVFATSEGNPSLVFQGDVATEWNCPQQVSFAGKTFSSHRRLLTQGLDKIKLGTGGDSDSIEFVYDSSLNLILMPVSATVTSGSQSIEYHGYAVRSPVVIP